MKSTVPARRCRLVDQILFVRNADSVGVRVSVRRKNPSKREPLCVPVCTLVMYGPFFRMAGWRKLDEENGIECLIMLNTIAVDEEVAGRGNNVPLVGENMESGERGKLLEVRDY